MVRIDKLSPKQIDIIRRPFNYELEVNEGTPRSGKTTAGHFRYARYLIQSEDENHLIAAYNQEQAYRLFIDGDGTGLMHIFNGNCWIKHDDRGDHLLIDTPKGQKRVYYKGGGKVNSVGAITGMSLGSVVFCEINLLHMDFIQECFRRTWAAKLRYHLADLNPPAPQHPVIKDVFDVQNTRWTHWTMDDNPILSEERKQSIINNLRKNPYLYKRDVLGQRVMPQGVIYGLFDMDKNIKDALIGEPVEMYFCGDGGQSDATSMSCNIVTRIRENGRISFRLNRVAHYYHSGADTGQVKAMSTYAVELKAFIKWCVTKYQMRYTEVWIDPACKSLREELHKVGIITRTAMNNSHDVSSKSKGIEVGIERGQNIISDERFVLVEHNEEEYDHYYFLKEIGLYSRDDNGKPIDKNNHAMDEFRYSVNVFVTRYVNFI
ncbi:PBSX family phage terminase large subunit [Streptococcus suis]|uniref:PBSX family phage terminase large subunit n=1 Tax=Streptococcus suis TaxID=1307 RepID=UPI0005CF5218|nr:PBSX family phage terminase large subunit [Streptococcus suis]NQF48929.1 PBSX family phage terminase large subunit [Streptococcus suis]NQS21407.1 PBSX family phage terminase large subunit [Streptococcus suis]NQS56551.1 PBSX family phage terminase large subunit [Streptococcus suis]CYW76033.1 phage terminase [Streptococcus suis]CYX07054.1 phage terminase [Streptococcus suis]